MYDDDLAVVESIAGERHYLAEDEPGEVAAFLRALEALREAASTGDKAEAVIQRALGSLGQS